MDLLQGLISTIANTLLLLIIVFLIRDARHLLAARLAIVTLMGSIGFSIAMLPEQIQPSTLLDRCAVFINAVSFGFQWLLGRALMEDKFKPRNIDWFLVLVLALIILAADSPVFGIELSGRRTFQFLALVAVVCVVGHLTWIAISGFRNDLLDNRRRIRIGFTTFMVLVAVVLLVLDMVEAPTYVKALAYDGFNILAFLIVLLWAWQLDADLLFSRPKNERHQPQADKSSVEPSKSYKKLLAMMEQEKIYQQADLTLPALANQLGLPAHKLRPLINQNMGYRNFSSFLNSYRLSEVEAALSDPARSNDPILTIALEAGYQTLSTFNRAFKKHFNETPTSFRERKLNSSAE